MYRFYTFLILLAVGLNAKAQNDTIYGMNFTTGNLQFASLEISSGNTTLYGNGPVTPDIFQGGVYDFDPIGKRYFYPRGSSVYSKLVTIDALTGEALLSPTMSNPTPSVIPFTNIAYNWMNDTLYGTHHAYENGQTILRFAWADIETGDVEILNSTPISTSPYTAGNSDIDPVNARYFLINGSGIKTVDIHTGAVLTNADIQFPLGVSGEFLVNIAYNWSDGLVYGLYMYPDPDPMQFGALLKLASVDPATGDLNIISQAHLSPDGFSSGDCDIDVIGGRYFYIRQGNLYLVDLATGDLLDVQSIQNPNGAIAPIINMAYDDLMLPQTVPALRDLTDTIFKAPGASVEINAFVNENASYMWSNGSTDASINTSQQGNYSVTIISDGFEIYGETIVIDQVLTSIEENKQELIVFPNPASESFTLNFTNNSDSDIILDLISTDGRLVMTQSFSTSAGQNSIALNVSDVARGPYTLAIRFDDTILQRIILLD